METTNTDTVVLVRDVHKSFGEQSVLNGLNVRVNRGETVAVLGRSGTGKSVLLRLVVGLERPDRGTIEVLGQDVSQLSGAGLNELRAKIGFLFQDAALYDSMTVADNVAFPLRHGQRKERRRSQHDADARAHELLAFVGMQDAAGKMPSELSGGMKKRVGLARALAFDPELLLCDEPTAALDPVTTSEIEALMIKMQHERHVTSLVVTHDLRSAQRIATRLAFMNHGQFVFDGPYDALRDSSDPFVCDYLKRAS